MYPVALFTYNRLEHTQKVVESLQKNILASATTLYICSDAPRNEEDKPKVEACRAYFKQIDGFAAVEVIELETNHNVKRAVKKMGDLLSSKYEAWIGIEDDAVAHPMFLQFMNDTLNYYKDNEKVVIVNAYAHEIAFKNALIKKNYPYDVVFGVAFHCFGWGTWSHKWKNFDISMPEKDYFKGLGSNFSIANRSWGHLMSHKVASKPSSELWDIHTTYYMLKNDLVAVWPVRGYIQNIGFDGTGLHGYNFDGKIFGEALDPKAKVTFTDDIELSRKYDFAIFAQVALKWVRAFIGNFFKIIFQRK
ncbi:hypothetical protein PVA45_02455 [Entomospira entomophila]|uniref:Glycosyltransferase 2-like domain-containing protein n=1 Tax=Entomospira entomophila TaxID=2719988 RepID=A0A968GCE7_9SPIO|nr:hypothetical protein [Entomospira entomophilus]NIZ40374.1 hypothetical protein [Entomospira entomophilus]WDI35933.1 hypothetical protein PVA45_02455 [Entomospira entomophilus]